MNSLFGGLKKPKTGSPTGSPSEAAAMTTMTKGKEKKTSPRPTTSGLLGGLKKKARTDSPTGNPSEAAAMTRKRKKHLPGPPRVGC